MACILTHLGNVEVEAPAPARARGEANPEAGTTSSGLMQGWARLLPGVVAAMRAVPVGT